MGPEKFGFSRDDPGTPSPPSEIGECDPVGAKMSGGINVGEFAAGVLECDALRGIHVESRSIL